MSRCAGYSDCTAEQRAHGCAECTGSQRRPQRRDCCNTVEPEPHTPECRLFRMVWYLFFFGTLGAVAFFVSVLMLAMHWGRPWP